MEMHWHLCPPVGPLSADHARDCPTPPAQKGVGVRDGCGVVLPFVKGEG